MATDRMCTIRVLISFNGLRRGESYALPMTSRLRAFAELGFIDVIQTITPLYLLDPDDDEDEG